MECSHFPDSLEGQCITDYRHEIETNVYAARVFGCSDGLAGVGTFLIELPATGRGKNLCFGTNISYVNPELLAQLRHTTRRRSQRPRDQQ